METHELFSLMEKIDNDETLPEGWTIQNVFAALRSRVDELAGKKEELDANLIVTSERAKKFTETKRVSNSEIERFKRDMVFIFREQKEKKFLGENYTAGIVVKKTIKPTREPKLSDYAHKDRMKFVKADFRWQKLPNADCHAALKSAGLGEFCDFSFSWDADVIKAEDKLDKARLEKDPKSKEVSKIDSFTEKVDSSFVQFKPKKGK